MSISKVCVYFSPWLLYYRYGIFKNRSQVFFEMKCKPQPTNTWLFSHIIIISMSFPLWFDEFFHHSNQIKNHNNTKTTYTSIDYQLYRLICKLVNMVNCEIFIMLTFKAQWKQTYFSPLAIASNILNENVAYTPYSYSLSHLLKWEYMLSKLNDRKKKYQSFCECIFANKTRNSQSKWKTTTKYILIPWKQNTKKYVCFTLN